MGAFSRMSPRPEALQRSITIAGRSIGPGQPPFVIAELSCNHNGSIEQALRIVEAAKACGADAIKLQTYTADTITLDHDGPGFVVQGGPWHGHRLYDLYRQAYTPWEWHEQLFARASELGLHAFSSPFDPTAVDFLETLGVPGYKIASFELVDLPLIEKAAATGKPLVMSTGMASDAEIAEAVEAARRTGSGEILLLHCVSGYPTPASEANLAEIGELERKFGLPVGLSDHTLGVVVPIAAVAAGAVAIEKHFTLARSDGGFDAAFSLEPDELTALTSGVRTAWEAMGRTGLGRKPSEATTSPFRRSLYVVADIAAGEAITRENVRSIRPGLGLPPKHLPEVLGRRSARAIARGTPLAWELLA